MRRRIGRAIGRGSAVLFLAAGALCFASTARAQATPSESAGGGGEQEGRLHDLSEKLEALGRKLEGELDLEASARAAGERWSLEGENLKAARSLLKKYREAHSGERSKKDWDRLLDEFTERARKSLGDDRGREFGAWLREKEKTVQAIGQEMGAIGEEMGRLGAEMQRFSAQDARASAESARELAELAQKEAAEGIRQALEGVSERVEDVPTSFDSEALQRQVREAMEQAREAQQQALEQLRQAVPLLQGVPLDSEKRIEEAMRAFEKSFQQGRWEHSLKDQTVRDLQEKYARTYQEQAQKSHEESLRLYQKLLHGLKDVGRDDGAMQRAKDLAKAERDRIRSRRSTESEELKRSQGEIEQLKQRVKDLEQEIEGLRAKKGVNARNV